jgi:hypothetical protein
MVPWIWGAAILMALGGLAALMPGGRGAAAPLRLESRGPAASRVAAEG